MALRVIEVDPADSFHSLRDRLLQGERGRAVLVLPARSAPVLNGINLILLRRLADRERLDIGLVATDRALIRQARAVGLPAFSNLTLAEHYRPGWWRAGRRSERVGFAPGEDRRPPERLAAEESAARSAGRGRYFGPIAVLLSIILLMGLLAGAAVYTLPYASVTLHPQTLPAQVIIDFTVDPAAVAVAERVLPARQVRLTQPWESTGPATDNNAADQERIRALVLQGLGTAAPGLLAARLAPGEMLVPASVQIDVTEDRFSQLNGEVLLTLQASLEGLAVKTADVNALAYHELAGVLPDGFVPQPGTVRVFIDEATDRPPDRLTITAQATGRARIDTATLASVLRGQRLEDVSFYLDNGLSAEPRIDIGPGWWRAWFGRLPLRAKQVRINLLP